MPKDWKGGLVRRAGQDAIYFSYKDPDWVHRASPYLWSKPGDEELAQKALNRICRALKDRKPFQDAGGAVTVRSFAKKWLETRPGTSSADDGQRLRDHVFPAIWRSADCGRPRKTPPAPHPGAQDEEVDAAGAGQGRQAGAYPDR